MDVCPTCNPLKTVADANLCSLALLLPELLKVVKSKSALIALPLKFLCVDVISLATVSNENVKLRWTWRTSDYFSISVAVSVEQAFE